MSTQSPTKLNRYGLMAKQAWKEQRPRMYTRLLKSGRLEAQLLRAQDQAHIAANNLMDQGYRLPEAEEIFLPEFILLPSEKEMPNLGENRDPEVAA
jgi:hypothetical protein